MIKKLLIILAIVLAVAGTVSVANAWTKDDCPTADTHPDCVQYFPTPSPTVTPTPAVSPTPKGDGPTGPTVENPAPVDTRPFNSFGAKGMG